MGDDIFAQDFQQQPVWWDESAPPASDLGGLSDTVDVLVIGSGFAGLNAALMTARAGMSTLVLDKGELGRGASTRLVGFIGRFLHYSIAKLIDMFGEEQAVAMYRESGDAHFHFLDFIKQEGFDVGLLYRGRFSAAHTPAAYEALAENARNIEHYMPFQYEMCPRRDQRNHVGSDAFYGGMILHEHGTVHPARYHRCLVDAVRNSGGLVVGNNAVLKVEGQRQAFAVSTQQGIIRAREVIACTNGYSNEIRDAVPYLRKRVVPVGGYQIATEPISADRMKAVKPSGMAVYDTRVSLNWDRPTPDDRVIVYGGRSGTREGDPIRKARHLHRKMVATYPDLDGVKIRRYWQGFMGFGIDRLTHVGCNEQGIHYATSFSASGLPLGTYFGQKVGRRVAGLQGAHTCFWNLDFPTRFFFDGNPWFVPLMAARYDLEDLLFARGNRKTG